MPLHGTTSVGRTASPGEAAQGLPGLKLDSASIRAIHGAKAITLLALIALVWTIKATVAPSFAAATGTLCILASLLASALITVWPQAGRPSILLLALLIDVGAVTICIHLEGGTRMISGPMAYVVILGLAGILLSESATWIVAGVVVTSYGAMAWTERMTWLTHQSDLLHSPSRQALTAIMVAAGACVATAMVTTTLRHLRGCLRRAEEQRRDSVMGLSRLLREPLERCREFADGIEREPEGGSSMAALRVQRHAIDAIDLVHNVLETTRLESDVSVPQPTAISVLPLLEQAERIHGAALKLRGVAIQRDGVPADLEVVGDQRTLSQIVGNVIAIAVESSPREGTIEAVAREQGGFGILELRLPENLALGTEDRGGPERDRLAVAWRFAQLAIRVHSGTLRVVHDERLRQSAVQLCLPTPARPGGIGARDGDRRGVRPAAPEAPETTVLDRGSLQSIFRVHSLVIVAIVLGLPVVRSVFAPSVNVPFGIIVLLLALIPNACGALSRHLDLRRIAVAGIACDVIALTYVIHFSGGIEATAGPMFYAIIIGVTGLIFAGRAAFGVAAACALAYATVVVAGSTVPGQHPHLYAADQQIGAVTLVSVCMLLAAWVTSYTVRQIRLLHARADQIRTEAVNALSHDLKNPLQVIHSYATLIDEADRAERIDMGQRIQAAAGRALDLVEAVLDPATIEARPLSPALAPLQLADLLREVVEHYALPASQKGLRLSVGAEITLPPIDGDGELLARAVGNLVSNAIKYTASGGRVDVWACAAGGGAEITVRDTGMGIPPKEQGRLFEKYTRSRAAGGIEGTGLGLHIVRSIAEAHGGAVRVESEVGRGSTFTIVLPGAKHVGQSAA